MILSTTAGSSWFERLRAQGFQEPFGSGCVLASHHQVDAAQPAQPDGERRPGAFAGQETRDIARAQEAGSDLRLQRVIKLCHERELGFDEGISSHSIMRQPRSQTPCRIQ